MKIRSLFFIPFIFVCFCCKAQDPHFSQYFSSPLSLNPALTGFFDGDQRIAINERQQWWNVGDNYGTTSVSADFKILPEDIPQFDTFGIGFSGIFDRSLNGALVGNYLSASAAYHKSLAGEGRQTLALGFQLNYADRFINFNRLSFASQFNQNFFDLTIPVDLNKANTDTKYLELNTGLLYALHTTDGNFYAGTSLYHASKPKETIFDPSGYTVPYRITLHGGGELNISNLSSVLFSGVFMTQGGSDDSLVGAAYAIKTSNDIYSAKFYMGLWYRVNESYIPYLGVDINNFSVGLNYSLSALSVNGYHPQTLEVSMIFRHKLKNNLSLCPRF